MQPNILPVKPGAISAEDKAALRDAGVIVIEHEEPNQLRLLTPTAELSGSDMLLAAMRGVLAEDGKARLVFSQQVLAALEAKRA